MDPNRSFGEMPLPLFSPAADDVVPAAKAAPSYLADHRARLRERFLQGGATAMPDYELLELVLFRAIPRQDVKPLARRLIETFEEQTPEQSHDYARSTPERTGWQDDADLRHLGSR